MVGESPSADGAMLRGRLIDNGAAGEKDEEEVGFNTQEPRDTFRSLCSPTAPSARDMGRCTDRWLSGVCVLNGDAIWLCKTDR